MCPAASIGVLSYVDGGVRVHVERSETNALGVHPALQHHRRPTIDLVGAAICRPPSTDALPCVAPHQRPPCVKGAGSRSETGGLIARKCFIECEGSYPQLRAKSRPSGGCALAQRLRALALPRSPMQTWEFPHRNFLQRASPHPQRWRSSRRFLPSKPRRNVASPLLLTRSAAYCGGNVGSVLVLSCGRLITAPTNSREGSLSCCRGRCPHRPAVYRGTIVC